MRLASLYSGGKDSTLSLYLAEQMGHSVEYLVNIISNSDDSMIFHVPNSNIVPLLAEAMDKRLITEFTDGSEEGDMNALRNALSDLDIKGVVTGAVLSDYQWERMNIVCDELDIVCIAPLWRKDQDDVMHELIDSGISSIIVGVYADGLDDKWLGKNISDPYDDLKRVASEKKISMIGEGGEYESLTLDSPMQHSSVVIEEYEKEWNGHSGTMNVKKAKLMKRS
ncbi:MAG: diphthine--ammonia ligase [Methanomassiliicoccaceae archaeon]|nr:diphthine--ammonia ligase [Methanomassiliicoccaceae archaeon]